MKSNVSDLLEVMQHIYDDACIRCIAVVSDLRDLNYIRSRVKDEGISFLTITLPSFCKDFEQALATGFIAPTAFRSFRKAGSIPAFLQGMIGLIFDKETGRIYDASQSDVSDHPTLVDSVRQICLAFKKLEIPCTPERDARAVANYIEIEDSFNQFKLCEPSRDYYRRVSSVLWGSLIPRLRVDMCIPRHGPGATAERISGNQKYVWRRWHERLEPFFPIIDSCYSYSSFDSEELLGVTFVQPEDEQPVRVCLVPKTLKGPRVIAIEPVCMQYAQQGIRSILYDAIESYWLTSGHINFRDQSVNQSLAITSSNDGRLATIDLSDASDRVPLELALEMFDSNPDFRDAVESCRSRNAELPDGRIIGPLKKFASMGSALCFPVEAMYFYTICVMALLEKYELPVTQRNIFKVSRSVYVYGDDIVVPSTDAIDVLAQLHKYNCKLNPSKTFYTGRFRESCGIDAYAGSEVTPIYIHTLRPENLRQVPSILSWTATANLFYKKGYWRTASHLFRKVERIVGSLPYVPEGSAGLGRTSFMGYCSVGRWNKKYHRFEFKAWVPVPVFKEDRLEGFAALQKSFLKLMDLKNPFVSRDALHLEHSALHGAVALKRRWVPTYISGGKVA
jgi:hypothetical protein